MWPLRLDHGGRIVDLGQRHHPRVRRHTIGDLAPSRFDHRLGGGAAGQGAVGADDLVAMEAYRRSLLEQASGDDLTA